MFENNRTSNQVISKHWQIRRGNYNNLSNITRRKARFSKGKKYYKMGNKIETKRPDQDRINYSVGISSLVSLEVDLTT